MKTNEHPQHRLRWASAAIGVALALSLAACKQQPEAPGAQASDETAAVPSAAPQAATPDASASASETEATAAGAPQAMTEIPEMLRGRWGLVAADCTSTRGDAKGLLTVSSRELRFYESVAKLTGDATGTDASAKGRFAFSGEGQSWTMTVSLMSPDGGTTMVRRDSGPDALPDPLTYTKCG